MDALNDLSTGFLLPRPPPHNLQLEIAVLGGLLVNNKAYERVDEFLRPEHFADPINGRIYDAIQRRIARGSVVDILILKTEFENACILDEVGGVGYLVSLASNHIGLVGLTDYAKTLVDMWRRRQMIDIGQRMVEEALDSGTDPMTITANATAAIDEVTFGDEVHKPTLMADAMMDALQAAVDAKAGKRISNVCTGFSKIDDAVGEWEPGNVYILGGRTSTGKSAVALQIALHNAVNEMPVDYYSTEMQARQLGRRANAMLTGVSSKQQKRGRISEEEYEHIQNAWKKMDKKKHFFNIQDCPGMNLPLITAKAKGFARKHPGKVGLVVIDHLHDLKEMSEDQMTTAVGKIAAGTKALSKTIGWPVLLLAQLNRRAENREDHRPEIADIYGGTQLEAIADTVMLLHRPDRYLGAAPPERKAHETAEAHARNLTRWNDDWGRLRDRLEVFFPKVRDDGAGLYVPLRFDGPSNRSTEIEEQAA